MMATHTYQGIIENGQIKLAGRIDFAERAKVVVTISDANAHSENEVSLPRPDAVARIPSVRLADPKDVEFFRKEVTPLRSND